MAFALFRTESNQRINCPIRTNTQRFCLARVLHYQPAPHHPGTQQEPARNRLDNGPYNLAILRHMALNLIRKEPSKGSLRVKIKRAGWKDAYLAKVLAQI